MKELTLTEDTQAGIISYKYLVLRPSRPSVHLLNVSIQLPNGDKTDLSAGFFKDNNMVLSDELREKMILEGGE